jgi:hypothetical protein
MGKILNVGWKYKDASLTPGNMKYGGTTRARRVGENQYITKPHRYISISSFWHING